MVRSEPVAVAIVTGAAGGIGSAVAADFVRSGVAVVANDRNEAGLQRLQGVVACAADVTTREGARSVVASALDAFGSPTILVNAVGGMKGSMEQPFLEIDEQQLDFALRINVGSTFHCMQAALEVMVPAGRGRIVNVASTAWAGSPDRPDYSAAKAAVVALSRSVAEQVAPAGITVNVVAPGITLTEAVRPVFAASAPDVPLGRWNDPEDVVAAVRYLCSDGARNVSGQILTVAGGLNPSL